MVILTFVLGAVIVTALAYALLFDRPEPRLQVVQHQDGSATSFEVTHAGGGLQWEEVTLRFLDRAGTDQAGHFLVEPSGDVDEGDVIGVSPQPPGGTYVLLVLKGGDELTRLVVEL